jgi:adenylyltransferase/sulfurtransferase
MSPSPQDTHFSNEELIRYGRHLVMPEIGEEGQKKLRTARVLIVGVGGLGSPAALYLAAAGIGTLGLVDFDAVDVSNLQRQILYDSSSVGKLKLEEAQKRITALNSGVKVEAHGTTLTSENAMAILGGYDVILDGTDRFATRYLINDGCVLLGKPNVYGSVYRFEGHVSVFDARHGPCYRCLHPQPPPPKLAPNCAEGGVLGVLPGIVGTIQATEAIKLLLGIGKPLIGRVLMVDGLNMKMQELVLRKDPQCAVCGEKPSVTSLIDYEEFCGGGSEETSAEISVEELNKRMSAGEKIVLLDVRLPFEYEIANLNGHLIPLAELEGRMKELDGANEIVVYCHTGARSARAVSMLRQSGYSKARNLMGGIDEWSRKIDKSVNRY